MLPRSLESWGGEVKSSVNHHSIVKDENMDQQAYKTGQVYVTASLYLKREKKLKFPVDSIKVDV